MWWQRREATLVSTSCSHYACATSTLASRYPSSPCPCRLSYTSVVSYVLRVVYGHKLCVFASYPIHTTMKNENWEIQLKLWNSTKTEPGELLSAGVWVVPMPEQPVYSSPCACGRCGGHCCQGRTPPALPKGSSPPLSLHRPWLRAVAVRAADLPPSAKAALGRADQPKNHGIGQVPLIDIVLFMGINRMCTTYHAHDRPNVNIVDISWLVCAYREVVSSPWLLSIY
jgi:hypothetical protein